MRIDTINPLVLAWVGDAVCHDVIRRYLVGKSTAKVHELERASTHYVSAKAQAAALDSLTLNEEEEATVRRGLNAQSGHCPKNSMVAEYRKATAFEAVIGSLKLQENEKRMSELLQQWISACEKEKTL